MTNRGARITTIVPILLIPALIYDAVTRAEPWTPLRITGLAVALIFLALLSIARFQLGNNFSIAPEAHQLVTTGVYSKIRNPVYVFGVIAIAGVVIYNHLYIALAAMLAFVIPMQVMRARAEARVLEAKFGDEYRNYRAKTWF